MSAFLARCGAPADPASQRRQAAAVTRQLALLKAHGVIVKVAQTPLPLERGGAAHRNGAGGSRGQRHCRGLKSAQTPRKVLDINEAPAREAAKPPSLALRASESPSNAAPN